MTRRDILSIHHEPFGDAFYFGPEKISPASLRWPPDKVAKSGKTHCTYDMVLQPILDCIKVAKIRTNTPVTADLNNPYLQDTTKRTFVKDMSYHIIPPVHSPSTRPPSLQHHFGPNETPNPTLLPTSILRSFRFVFLIRKPSSAIPSLHRCFIPPLSSLTDEKTLDPTELGYRELRILYDYLYPPTPHSSQPTSEDDQPILIDAEDLLADPDTVINSLCSRLGIPYSHSMLEWPSQEDHDYAMSLFQKYAGYHQDALNSTALQSKPRSKVRSKDEENLEWERRYGDGAARMIRGVVDACQEDYEYLRQFRMQF